MPSSSPGVVPGWFSKPDIMVLIFSVWFFRARVARWGTWSLHSFMLVISVPLVVSCSRIWFLISSLLLPFAVWRPPCDCLRKICSASLLVIFTVSWVDTVRHSCVCGMRWVQDPPNPPSSLVYSRSNSFYLQAKVQVFYKTAIKIWKSIVMPSHIHIFFFEK